jgi:hypothetical protein
MPFRDRQTFGASELETFLRVVDRHLTVRTRIEVVGGAAAALAHRTESTTDDLDTRHALTRALEEAVKRASQETGLHIPWQHAGIAEMPFNYEDRLQRHLADLVQLEVWVVDKHDLTLSKGIRCEENDLQQLEEINRTVGLSYDVLIERFITEMDHITGPWERHRSNFFVLVERLFGEMKRVAAERALRAAGR